MAVDTLSDVHFRVQFGCGFDLWRIFGMSSNIGKVIAPGTPIKMEKIGLDILIQTVSGSYYLLLNVAEDESFVSDLAIVIKNGGFETIT